MPLHLNSITNDSHNTDLISWILHSAINSSSGVFFTEDKKYFHLAKLIHDERTGKEIGRFIFTLFYNENMQHFEVLDLDIVLNNPNVSNIHFIRMLPDSSDSNEYHDVEVFGGEQRLIIETVNRHVLNGSIAGTSQSIHVSAFPFELSVYDSMETLNSWAGFDKVKEVGYTGIKVGGFSQYFTAPGNVFSRKNGDNKYSFIIGRAKSFDDITVQFGNCKLDFTIIWLDTALGVIPVAASREVFDLSSLDAGRIVAMNANIKADFADYAIWNW